MTLDTLENTALWFKKAVPNPTPTNVGVQLGCHLEEVAEMLDTIEGLTLEAQEALNYAWKSVKALADHMKANPLSVGIDMYPDYLDALCDQIVTAVGCSHMSGMQIVPAMKVVNKSNFSKFDNEGRPIFAANGKITKGPNYAPPDLTPFI